MAGKKRPKSAPSKTENARKVHSPAAPRPSPSTKKPRRISKGRVEFIEIDSDEEKAQQQPKLRGPLRDLDVNALIQPKTTTKIAADYLDDNGDATAKPQTTQPAHTTRSTINGRASAVYDQRYHPSYDDTLRPLVAARYNSDLRSNYKSAKHETDGETSGESEPTLAGDSDSDQSGVDNDSDSPVTSRAPDPKASRHSTRAEAQKPRNYSRKFHPNDLDLPGFKAKAKAALKSGQFIALKRPKKRKSGKGVAEDVPADSATDKGSTSNSEEVDDGKRSDDDQVAEGDDDQVAESDEGHQEGIHEDAGDVDPGNDERPQTARKADGPPRKKLKSTSSGSPSAMKARKKSQPRKLGSFKKAKQESALGLLDAIELNKVVDEFAQGSQLRPISVPDDHQEDDHQEDDHQEDDHQEDDHQEDEQDSEDGDDEFEEPRVPSRMVDTSKALPQSALSSSKQHGTQNIPTKRLGAQTGSELSAQTDSDGVAAAPTPTTSSGHRMPQSDGYRAAPSPRTHLQPGDVYVRTPDHRLSSDGTEHSDASAAATTTNNTLALHKSRSTAASPTYTEGEYVKKALPHEDDASEDLDVDHDRPPSHFIDALANTPLDTNHQLDGPADDLRAEERVVSSISESDGAASFSSGIVPRLLNGEEEEDSNDDEEEEEQEHLGKSRNAVLPSAIKMVSTQQALAGKARGALDMMPATQPRQNRPSSVTLSGATVKSRVKTSSTLRSSATSSASKGLSGTYDGASYELETLWRASQKPGGSYRAA
ncbi:hypothetical protein LTS10_012737 [Elasticomyces elasticus]|nr:hypothetical protein LTS10_012737 [Elasticomyces elasticus]